MQLERMRLHLSKVLLAVLAVLAASAFGHRMLVFSTPLPTEPEWSRLQIEGYQLETVRTAPTVSTQELALGRSVVLRGKRAGSATWEFDLILVPVHSRESSAFSVSQMTAGRTDIHIASAAIFREQAAERLGEFQTGTLADGKHAMQTCLIRNARAGVNETYLVGQAEGQRVRGLIPTLQQIAGLRVNIKWECLLITITAAEGWNPTHSGRLLDDLLVKMGRAFY
jgi:hypothetical protein